MLRDILQGRVGLRRRRDVRLVRRRADRGGAAAPALDLVMPGPDAARGATRSSRPCATGASARRRSTTRCCGCCGSPRASARSTASSRPRRPRRAWADERGRRRAARHRGRRLRARSQRGRAAAARRRAALRRVAVARPQRRASPARSAAAAPPSSRPTPSRRSTACAPRSATASRSTTRPACAATRALAVAAALRAAGRRAASRCASSPPTAPCSARERRPGGAFTWLGAFAEGVPIDAVAAVEVHARLRAPRPGEHVVGCSGIGPLPRSTLDGRGRRSTTRSSCRRAPTPSRRTMRPPQRGATVALERGRGGRASSCATSSAARGGASTSPAAIFQLNVEPPHGPTTRRSRARWRLPRRPTSRSSSSARPRRSRARASTATRSRCPGRQDELVRARGRGQPAHGRRRQRRRARAAAVGRRGAAPCCSPGSRGQEFGHALADVLLGAAEPGGRLPTTWPRARGGLPGDAARSTACSPTTRGSSSATAPTTATAATPRFPFGHGLGYTTWELRSTGSSGDGRTRGARCACATPARGAGREVVQVYASGPDSAVERPRALARRASRAVDARARRGGRRSRSRCPRARFAHWDAARGPGTVEPGTFTLAAGPLERATCGSAPSYNFLQPAAGQGRAVSPWTTTSRRRRRSLSRRRRVARWLRARRADDDRGVEERGDAADAEEAEEQPAAAVQEVRSGGREHEHGPDDEQQQRDEQPAGDAGGGRPSVVSIVPSSQQDERARAPCRRSRCRGGRRRGSRGRTRSGGT